MPRRPIYGPITAPHSRSTGPLACGLFLTCSRWRGSSWSPPSSPGSAGRSGGRGHPDRRRQYRRLHADNDDGDRARDQQGQSVARPRPRPDRDQHRRQRHDLRLRCQGRTVVVRRKLAAAMLIGSALFAGEPSRADEAIVLASTTSVENSGLLAHILPEFTRETGISVRVLAQGTGQALAATAHGDADLVLVHDPEAEAEFIAQGHGIERRQIAWNDFIVVGPRAYPAHVAGGHDAVAAFSAIAAAGAPFMSRGDKSGTDALEHRLWRAAGIDPAQAGGGSWYRDIGGGNKGGLTVLVEGDPRLLNRYDVILLDPQKHPEAKQTSKYRPAALPTGFRRKAKQRSAPTSSMTSSCSILRPPRRNDARRTIAAALGTAALVPASLHQSWA